MEPEVKIFGGQTNLVISAENDKLLGWFSEKKTSVKPFGGIFAFIRHCSEGKSGKQERKWERQAPENLTLGLNQVRCIEPCGIWAPAQCSTWRPTSVKLLTLDLQQQTRLVFIPLL